MISSFAQWWFNFQFTCFPINLHVHEAIECNRYLVGTDTVRFQRRGQITKAAAVRLLVAVNDAESVLAAWREKEVVPADRVVDDTEHHIAAIGVEWIAGSQVNAAGVVECSSRGYDFSMVMCIES